MRGGEEMEGERGEDVCVGSLFETVSDISLSAILRQIREAERGVQDISREQESTKRSCREREREGKRERKSGRT